MTVFILLDKAKISFIWLILITNMVISFPSITVNLLYIMTAFLSYILGLQPKIFLSAFGDKIKITRWEKWSILIFGIFALLDSRRNHMIDN
ncbi:DUF1145 domain-containing protein [Candidatus Enterovibrio escicola]|uniref:Uncharacterized protein n=1 Tax=Candidatus Enterovibrio escicola TaxID=1927127 RepID=A0A2A5T545_9GAMM|nr:DUF1145 domain-containing protein [Candidatus Enterovibrio escacola]PCS23266.1 hypothetical protein BTN49_1263 [Candidatus Enterovibrio escacola]